ncbi:MAG TPA: hypothetical protein VM262_14750 [Acidimicrobiales bacterium]|nr:hypothetical protein [Acidimicrobiales bacterium]
MVGGHRGPSIATIAIASVLVAVAAGVAVAGRGGDASGVPAAVEVLEDTGRFTTAVEAGDALAEVGALLQLDARRCRDRDVAGTRDCDGLFAAAAAAQVFAAHVLGCTAPGRHEARIGLLAHLSELEWAAEEGATRPPPPSPPAC